MDDVQIEFPVELLIKATPISLGASARSIQRWRGLVRRTAQDRLQAGRWATVDPVTVAIFYFPPARMQGDIDNIAKPILDALGRLVFVDDNQVEMLLIAKFEPGRVFPFADPTEILAQAIGSERPCLYVRVDDQALGGALSWV